MLARLFQNWWYQKTDETITLSTSHILYRWHDRTKHWQVLNYYLLIAKYRIFCTGFRGDVLDFQNFLFFSGHQKTWNPKRDRDCKKELPKLYGMWAILLYMLLMFRLIYVQFRIYYLALSICISFFKKVVLL